MAAADFSRLITAAADTIAAHAEELTALDQAIGDGDHGLNMKRGFEAVRAEADVFSAKPLPEALKAVGTKLVMTVGGASGPLFGTFFMALGKDLPAAPDRGGLTAAFGRAIDAVAARGKSQVGQKTMLDVLQPVYEALAQGKTAGEIADAADKAAEATVPMRALRGRASFLGERSIGHMDAGARSTALLVRAVAEAIEGN
ncbi:MULTISPECIES: dihydroxyacetone kinase subunit DhaL [unclassified Mesorhizobium]|uniref:dihydroxyacetone kinase subunit DhaL n=1 Tax=unclassified Mesorhizobium TaxID=325217 RepID=UPI000F76465D|nr:MULTISPECIES: dihydroxyacetone kinase subunit DhaL [unclassified Mesorhizobium]AZO04874.1 dihydroxyacetone kinase subunit L [Mesorhizobium sp. M2A.F.Ca.ET.043.02.1.1]RUW43107.1 dihydroxyacetone kinase subunit L [Mesorhizobium sp. M2A.F.Ca.ET.015.02.1.1]RUW69482.1 dihydroxyacetone kinase subunit L [Mesorhizobium sp. M2A.F.Ca.ET.067.02.1.1]RVC90608.1 dihydroxyacetone kinase subunit L [Mesorhizobium sp. M2A.F.Ca.ET.017.03.2.1]RVC99637.1 dihydroxyacetone kinase subunit L [Mesorhizobium sp. M2A.